MYDVKIERDIGESYLVSVWRKYTGWIIVSRHKYLANAEEIKTAIEKGLKRDDIIKIINNQDSRCNTKILKYHENW